ncbi:MAG: septum formation initiator family protein [Alistipes sp.]|nr:septum formation initiator family protein [Alistipes sp.]MBR5131568.1 septum formation initiator family protein [Alistipes sp.]
MDLRASIVKYFWITLSVAIAIFTVIVSVRTIDDIVKTKRRHADVEVKVAELQANITRDSTFIEDLQHSPEFLEKFARESFLLQRRGEDVYVIERK